MKVRFILAIILCWSCDWWMGAVNGVKPYEPKSTWDKWTPSHYAGLSARIYDQHERAQRSNVDYIKNTRKDRGKFDFEKRMGNPRSKSQWYAGYDGTPYGNEVFLIVLLSIWMGWILCFIVNCILGRAFKVIEDEEEIEHPQVSIVQLQQTPMERKLSQAQQIGIDWYARHFVIRANDAYMDLDHIVRSDIVNRTPLQRNPWALARQIPKLLSWYFPHKKRHAKKKADRLKKKQELKSEFDKERREVELEEDLPKPTLTYEQEASERLSTQWKP